MTRRHHKGNKRRLLILLMCIVMAAGSAVPAFGQEEGAQEQGEQAVQAERIPEAEAASEVKRETEQIPEEELIPEAQTDPEEMIRMDAKGAGPAEDQEEPDLPAPWAPGDPVMTPGNFDVNVLNGSQLLLTWTCVEGCSGYEVGYAKNALFLLGRKVKVADPEAADLTLNQLKTSSKYFVRIRSVYTSGGRSWYSEWVRVSTGKASEKAGIRFVKRNGKKLDVRKQAGKKLQKYTITQGCCSDGKYIYMAFEQRNGDSNGNKKARIKIAKVRISDWKLVKVSPKGMKLGHANDLTYNPYKKYLVVTGAKVKDPYVRTVSVKTLKKTGTKKVKLGTAYQKVKAFNTIDFDPDTRTYLIRSRSYGGLTFTLNEQFRSTDVKWIHVTWGRRHIQGCTTSGGHLILTQSWNQSSGKNTLTIFDQTGKKLQDIRISMKGELESVFMIGGRLFATMHKKMKGYKTGYVFEVRL